MKKAKNEMVRSGTVAATSDAEVAAQFRVQIQAVNEADRASLRERARLGAMLIKWERYLGDGRGGRGAGRGGTTAGEGLKGWLEANLPELGYSAALGYKQLAAKVWELMGRGTQALESICGAETVVNPAGETVDIEAAVVAERERIFAEADSRRKLEQMWFEFSGSAARKAGRPKGSKADYAGYRAEALSPAAAARALWSKVIEPAQAAGLVAAARLLVAADCRDALAVLEPLADALRARRKELGC